PGALRRCARGARSAARGAAWRRRSSRRRRVLGRAHARARDERRVLHRMRGSARPRWRAARQHRRRAGRGLRARTGRHARHGVRGCRGAGRGAGDQGAAVRQLRARRLRDRTAAGLDAAAARGGTASGPARARGDPARLDRGSAGRDGRDRRGLSSPGARGVPDSPETMTHRAGVGARCWNGGMTSRTPLAAAAVLGVALLSGCVAPPPPGATSGGGLATPPEGSAGPVQPAGDPVVIASGLTSPWSVVLLPEAPGEALVSERDTGVVQHLSADGSLAPIGTVPGVVHQGEGGLLGLALLDDAGSRWLYAYLTTASDNRIVRMPLGDDLALGAPNDVLTGLAKAGNHDGGRIAFGPDGMLYATVGDAAVPDRAQDPASLNGKILRMTPEGGVPSDNPFSDSLVYSLGHRNPQGLAWDDAGQLWAAEFGQNTWDEVNRILPGGNYGWPVVEGQGGVDGYLDPVVQWPTSEASPSALTYVDGTFFVAALRGSRVWALYPTAD